MTHRSRETEIEEKGTWGQIRWIQSAYSVKQPGCSCNCPYLFLLCSAYHLNVLFPHKSSNVGGYEEDVSIWLVKCVLQSSTRSF